MKACSNALSADNDSLFTSIRWPRGKSPKRAESLATLEHILPWSDLEGIVRRVYFSDQRKTGRPGYSAAMMLRCLVLCWFWSLSDDQAESVILDSFATARFIGTDPWKPKPPSASAIREFRKRLDSGSVLKEVKEKIDSSISAAGVCVCYGMVKEPIFKRPSRRRPSTACR
jgi:hypothetical protein